MSNSNNLFSKKKNKENNKENKKKQEEEMNNETGYSIDVIPMNYKENLDYIVGGIKLKNSLIER